LPAVGVGERRGRLEEDVDAAWPRLRRGGAFERVAASPEGAPVVPERTFFLSSQGEEAVPEGYLVVSVNEGVALRRLEERCWLGGCRQLLDASGVGADKPHGGCKVRRPPAVGVGRAAGAVRGLEQAVGSPIGA